MTTTLFNRAAAALLVLCLGAGSALAETLEFEGRVEAVHHAELASHLNGIITEIAFEGGEEVQAGDPLIMLDPAEFELAVAQAKALLASASAQLTLAGLCDGWSDMADVAHTTVEALYTFSAGDVFELLCSCKASLP